MSRPWLRMDLAPLAARDFRLLFASGTVTQLGTQATAVALVVQVKQLTGSAFAVGLLGAAELVPLVAFALYGGVLADDSARRAAQPADRGGRPAVQRLSPPPDVTAIPPDG